VYLLDTHTFLWWISSDPRLSPRVVKLLSKRTDCFLSLASCWEMAIKVSVGRLQLPVPLQQLVPEQMSVHGFRTLPIKFRHCVRVAGLPLNSHRDPFDRLLVAQSIEEHLTLLSADPQLDQYSVRRVWD